MASQLWYAWSNYYWYQRYGMRLYQRSHTIPYPCGMIIWNGMTLELTYHTIWYYSERQIPYHLVWLYGNGMALESTYHTIWYECMEWYGFGIHIPYHMVWVYGMVWLWNPHTIPYGMSVWNGYHTIWYYSERQIPYHVVWFRKVPYHVIWLSGGMTLIWFNDTARGLFLIETTLEYIYPTLLLHKMVSTCPTCK